MSRPAPGARQAYWRPLLAAAVVMAASGALVSGRAPEIVLVMPVLLPAAGAFAVSGRPAPRARRRSQIESWSRKHGWSFEMTDAALPDRWDGPPVARGSAFVAKDVVRGEASGLHVLSCTLRSRATGAVVGPERRFDHLVAVTLPAPLPDLSLRPHHDDTSRDRLAQDVVTESPAFNAEWRVQGGDLRTVHGILHPGTLERLMAEDVRGAHIRTEGSSLLVWWPGATDVDLLDERVAAAVDLAGRIPRHVWQDHGYDPMTARPSEE